MTVTLTGGGADGVIGTPDDTTATTTTDENGEYLFEDLDPGTEYKVTFSDLPAGTEFTIANQGGDDALDSDADTNGHAACTTLDPGEYDPTWDAGIYIPLMEGCSHTIGYWKTHAGLGPQVYHPVEFLPGKELGHPLPVLQVQHQ